MNVEVRRQSEELVLSVCHVSSEGDLGSSAASTFTHRHYFIFNNHFCSFNKNTGVWGHFYGIHDCLHVRNSGES